MVGVLFIQLTFNSLFSEFEKKNYVRTLLQYYLLGQESLV